MEPGVERSEPELNPRKIGFPCLKHGRHIIPHLAWCLEEGPPRRIHLAWSLWEGPLRYVLKHPPHTASTVFVRVAV